MTGEELKQARIQKNLTQRKLGLLLGYKIATADVTIQRWEYGNRPIPSKHWRALSELLEIPLDRFIP